MQMSMYQASAPVFTKMLTNLAGILDKAQAHAESKKFDPTVLLESRLSPDMLPFTKQIHIATDFARGCIARLAGQEPPKFEDNERSFAELKTRIERSIAAIKEYGPAQIDGSENREINIKMGGQPKTFTGQKYLQEIIMPNFFFHVTTAYALLRHNGVELGKKDFVGPV